MRQKNEWFQTSQRCSQEAFKLTQQKHLLRGSKKTFAVFNTFLSASLSWQFRKLQLWGDRPALFVTAVLNAFSTGREWAFPSLLETPSGDEVVQNRLFSCSPHPPCSEAGGMLSNCPMGFALFWSDLEQFSFLQPVPELCASCFLGMLRSKLRSVLQAFAGNVVQSEGVSLSCNSTLSAALKLIFRWRWSSSPIDRFKEAPNCKVYQ